MRLPSPLLAIAIAIIATSLAPRALSAQGSGRLIGRVVDADRGAPIAGAQVDVVGGATTATAADGRYEFQAVPAGTASVRVRMIGFSPKVVTGIEIAAGRTAVQDIALAASAVQLTEVVVTSAAERGSVARAIDEQRTASAIVNTVSAEQIARSPDADAAQAVQRVSGVTVQDGRYVLVRGLGERYTTTSLNGSRIPSPEPERKVVPLDLFPSALLEGITTSKTFTVDQPGDFSGARVDLKTRDFPTGRAITISSSAGFNTAATGAEVVKAPTTGGEWLGLSSSSRQLPQIVRDAGDFSTVTDAQQNQIAGSFRNAWNAHQGRGAPNGSAGLSVGGQGSFLGRELGYIGSLSYSTAQEVHKDETKGLATNGPTPGTALPFNTYTGSSARSSVLWGSLFNLSTRLGTGSKLALSTTYTRTADNDASDLRGTNEEFARDFAFTRLTYTVRSALSSQLHGEHALFNGHRFDWQAGYARVTRDEPDRSDLGYIAETDPATGLLAPVAWFGQARFATRTFSALSEHSWELGGSYRLPFGRGDGAPALKAGGQLRTVGRNSDTRAYDIVNRTLSDSELQQGAETIFDGAYAAAGRLLVRPNANAGRYTADDKVAAGYAQVELPLLDRSITVTAGARVERWALDLESVTSAGTVVPVRRRVTDLLPAASVTVRLTPSQNLRFAASQTLSRPEYRELSPVPYFEGVGLLTTFGNPDLRRALIQNYDVRWEWYPRGGEVISLGAFAKRFTGPIEKVIVPQAGASALGFVNATTARNFGLELEFRKGLDMLLPALAPVELFVNATLMRSRIQPGSAVLTNADRPMVGQSPYVINLGLSYLSGSGRWSATALYNVSGRRILEAGAGGLPDSYEAARHLLDLSLQAPVVSGLSVKFDAKNLLDAPYRLTQGDVLRERYTAGRVFSAGFTWRP